MNYQFTHPYYLLLLLPAMAWVIWLFRTSDVQVAPWRRWTILVIRTVVLLAVCLALAGLQWLKPMEGVNVFFVLDRSDSIPSHQQEAARRYVNEAASDKEKEDRVGVLVFGSEAAIESSAAEQVNLEDDKVLAVVGSDRTDLAGAIRLGTAAFPETGQKRLVLLSDGNENIGDAYTALLSARALGVSLDVIPLGADRTNDTTVQKLGLPSKVKKGTAFETKIFVETDVPQLAKVRLYRNEQPLGEQEVQLTPGKNLYSFPQTLNEAGFYRYTVHLDTEGDVIPQNNQATGFIHVRGDPRILLVSADPQPDLDLAQALAESKLEVIHMDLENMPTTLEEIQSYDAIFISNLAAGDLGQDQMRLLESAVKDFGVGLVCVGGDNTYAAGGYRGTPLERTLPLNMELDSKKVLPNGAVVLLMHGMEFNNGNQIARDCAQGVLDALGPQDELGVVLWDGQEKWLFPLEKVGDKRKMRSMVAGMNQGDLPSFQNIMGLGFEGLKKSTANLKHMIVFSDGDPGAPSDEMMAEMRKERVTVSTVLISGHFGPDTMIWIADQGRGRFYNVNNAGNLPQVFIKEAAVILKSAIFEDPFKPVQVAASELTRGIGADEYPILQGYVATSPKARAEIPLVSDKGDPILAHWQFGLGRAVAFTSDAKSRWAREWMGWARFRQFWSQIAQWSLRRVENADFNTEVQIEEGNGHVVVEALDAEGNYRNFLNLQAAVVSPDGERQTVFLEQKGPGRYETTFPTKEIGSYLLNVMEVRDGQLIGAQTVGTSVNYSPEFNEPEPNINLLQRLAESGGGRLLDPTQPDNNPFLHDRRKTFQPFPLWEWLVRVAILLFVLDIALRRIQIEQDQWAAAMSKVKHTILFWKPRPGKAEADESLAALLTRRDKVRERHKKPVVKPDPTLFEPSQPIEEVSPILPAKPSAPKSSPATTPDEETKEEEEAPTTTSRLLAAKRRAKKRLDD